MVLYLILILMVTEVLANLSLKKVKSETVQMPNIKTELSNSGLLSRSLYLFPHKQVSDSECTDKLSQLYSQDTW